jgi:hypothetical protein
MSQSNAKDRVEASVRRIVEGIDPRSPLTTLPSYRAIPKSLGWLPLPASPLMAVLDLYRSGMPLDATDGAFRATLWVGGYDPTSDYGRAMVERHRSMRYEYLTGNPF